MDLICNSYSKMEFLHVSNIFLSEKSVRGSGMTCHYLRIQHQTPSTRSGIRHCDEIQDT